MTTDRSLDSDYFDRVYAANDDPWDFECSAYEAGKYDETLAALPRPSYPRALEIGCSIGVLTARLASRCEQLLAIDVSETALAAARRRCAMRPHVEFARVRVPQSFPSGCFDLVLLSEVGYYWSRTDLALAVDAIERSLAPGATLLLVHWTPPVHDYPLTGDEVHEHVMARTGPGGTLDHLAGRRYPQYRLDAFSRR